MKSVRRETDDELEKLDNFTKPLPVAETAPGSEFTGVARSIECYRNNEIFQNYRILTLHIEKGKVKRIDYSDPYASFEALVKTEIATHTAIINLGSHWEHGKALSK